MSLKNIVRTSVIPRATGSKNNTAFHKTFLTFKVPITTAADDILIFLFFFFFFQEKLCESSAQQMIHIKCQVLFRLKKIVLKIRLPFTILLGCFRFKLISDHKSHAHLTCDQVMDSIPVRCSNIISLRLIMKFVYRHFLSSTDSRKAAVSFW